jgi:large subunit ribosomal protein L15
VFEAGSCVDIEALQASGLVKKIVDGIKILATGDLTKALTVKAHKFSTAARNKIISVGGTVEEI